MLTTNYQALQYQYAKPKKNNKKSQLTKEVYPLKKGDFSASTWKEYKDWLKKQKSKKTSTKKKKKAPKPAKKVVTRKQQYQKELQDKRWKELSLSVMKRDNFQCALCGSKNNLNVHHTEYQTGKKAWEYPTSVLITLCSDCHTKVHSDKNHQLNPYRKK